ncbi:Hypothetical Protein FCC1311_104062 [Hondaea fermentalgiana]|uniref:Ca3427-like PBP 2 domain-containing protein n=1 Tax=Hondaea fermentalgiana TaxID=2315210 RepID=A0A2R5GTJ3_9STRA|nr:Hypothetical Protein FCC1311_104062 [Hondaea fermentalgiana]|eukprot:GBG34182.1 Hypothetical Protein FCC1311_104062 [Hondaea fermentalgiana]
MGDQRQVRVGGVPEHFNAPFHLAKDAGAFEARGVDMKWTDFPGGTGDMCKALSAREVDVAIMLTEGALAHAMNTDPKVKLVGVHVSSSAIWGIHAGSKSCTESDIKDMKGKAKFAISRFGSGSHLMSYVLAESLGWDTKEGMEFQVVGGLKGAIEELPKDGSLVFMWEKFTTLPYVVDGTFKRIGEFPTPWPFFVVAAHEDFLSSPTGKTDLVAVLDAVREQAASFKNGGETSLAYIKEHYKIEPEAAAEWMASVTWALAPTVDVDMLKGVADTLHRLGKIETTSGEAPSTDDVARATASLA